MALAFYIFWVYQIYADYIIRVNKQTPFTKITPMWVVRKCLNEESG
jgi:hypothetical protein